MSDLQAVDWSFEVMFEKLYRDLSAAFPHPFEWIGLMECPAWWRFRARAAHRQVREIFAAHGFILTDGHARAFRQQPPQGAYGLVEDAGGAIIRQLRQTFQYQTGVPWSLMGYERGSHDA